MCELYEREITGPGPGAPRTLETWCRTHNCARGSEACLRSVMYDAAHLAASLGSGSDGFLRGRFISISNMLNAAIGRKQSSHGDQFDAGGNVTRPDPLNN